MVDSVSPQLLRRLHASLQQVVSDISSFLQLTLAPRRAHLSAQIEVFPEKTAFIYVFIYENSFFFLQLGLWYLMCIHVRTGSWWI